MFAGRIIRATVETIRNRSLAKGGFSLYDKGPFRIDATAWAILALESYGANQDLTDPACQRLAKSQLIDGRLSIFESRPESYWPTALALLAWKKMNGYEKELNLAIRFLLNNRGRHWPQKSSIFDAHDPSLRGWPWIGNTYSWIEPTSLTVLALKICGQTGNDQVLEAIRMILDRQLPSGGWNYGNKRLFGTPLLPIPESTGYALSALAGLVHRDQVRLSLDYLESQVQRIRTPLALSWSIFGLAGWSHKPAQVRSWIIDSLLLQKRYGAAYDTTLLSQLMVAFFAKGDLLSLFS